VRVDRIHSNFKQIELSEESFEKVSAIGKGRTKRFNLPAKYSPTWRVNTFDEEGEAEFPAQPIV
jgi:L-glyceraldehyde reductase